MFEKASKYKNSDSCDTSNWFSLRLWRSNYSIRWTYLGQRYSILITIIALVDDRVSSEWFQKITRLIDQIIIVDKKFSFKKKKFYSINLDKAIIHFQPNKKTIKNINVIKWIAYKLNLTDKEIIFKCIKKEIIKRCNFKL